MAKKCAGLNTKGRLVSGYRWVKGAKCPKKAKGKAAAVAAHTPSGKKRGRPAKSGLAKPLSPWEWFSRHGKSANEEAAAVAAHTPSGKKRGRPAKSGLAKPLSPWEWFSRHGKSANEEAAMRRNLEHYQELHGVRGRRRR